jgi:hypothetical protein
MTKEEREKEAIKRVDAFIDTLSQDVRSTLYDRLNQEDVKDFLYGVYIDSAEPREKRIEELEAQIEKMRCCYNCKQNQDESYCKIKKSDVNDLSCWDCGCDKWEIKEK